VAPEEQYLHTLVYGWDDKADDQGCTVVLIARLGGPWTSFARLMGTGTSRWDSVSGGRWGVDSPEADRPTDLNAAVKLDGTLELLSLVIVQ
jgi:hypothetical protein